VAIIVAYEAEWKVNNVLIIRYLGIKFFTTTVNALAQGPKPTVHHYGHPSWPLPPVQIASGSVHAHLDVSFHTRVRNLPRNLLNSQPATPPPLTGFFEMPSQDFTSFKCPSKYAKKNLSGFKGNKWNKLHLVSTSFEHVYEMWNGNELHWYIVLHLHVWRKWEQ
jgi:hypothetical protein